MQHHRRPTHIVAHHHQRLVRYTPGEGCRVFTKSDGLQSEQFLPNAALKASDGKIYIGSVNGFNAFYPIRLRQM